MIARTSLSRFDLLLSRDAFRRMKEEYFLNRVTDYASYRGCRQAQADKYCRPCSELFDPHWFQPTVVSHTHNSSFGQCMKSGVNSEGMWACGVCEVSPHLFLMSNRRYVLVSSSMLNNAYQYIEYFHLPKDAMHMDFICIPGATLKVMLRALAAETTNSSTPMDILFAGGHNNLLRYQTYDMIKRDMDRIVSWVKYQDRFHPGQSNTVAFATLLPLPKVTTPL